MPADRNPELFDDDNPADEVVPAALQGVLVELGAADEGSKVIVSRFENHGGVKKKIWLFECHPSDFDLKDVQAHHGAGDYHILVIGRQPGTNYKIAHANKCISI